MIAPSVTSFQFQCSSGTALASGASYKRFLRIRLNLSNDGDAYGMSISKQQEQERNPNPVFPPLNDHQGSFAPTHHHQEIVHEIASSPISSDAAGQAQLSPKGVYQINSEEEYRNLLKTHPDKLIVLKFFASFCRSCKALEPKMLAIMRDEQLEGLPILWAEFQVHRTTKDFFRTLGIITLPTIHFYDGSRGVVENFPCPPNKAPLLKKKLARFINARVDPNTYKLLEPEQVVDGSIEPRVERAITINELITGEHLDFLRNDLPFFQDLTDDEFDTLIKNSKLLTFDSGDIIRKQGMPGTTFYVIKSGPVEMSIKSKFDDPISTPPSYLGVVVGTLRKFDYFGERALTTGEPFAASFRALDKVRCFAFHVDSIPPSSILSKQRLAPRETVELLNRRYVLPEGYSAPQFVVTKRDENILDLLVRFQQIRQAARCFDYMIQNCVNWGDEGEIRRRTLLVRKLSYSQRNEFNDVFNIVDVEHRGIISLLEMKKFRTSAREAKTDSELSEIISRANPSMEGGTFITRDEFMGVMAEAEFYNLFRETFQELDQENTGFVRAGDLDSVLGGVRDLIGDKRHTNIIDVDDKDMLVDYEQFSKMLLGAGL